MLRHDSSCDFTGTDTRLWWRLDQFGKTKVQNLRVTITSDHDVLGFQISMDDARCMCLRKSLSNVLQVAQQLSQFSSFAMNLFTQCYAIDKLHRDIVGVISFTDLKNLCDVGMA